MKILSISAQKPNSTGSGVYLSELVRSFARLGHTQAVVAGIDVADTVLFSDPAIEMHTTGASTAITFYPVHFSTPDLPFPVVGMSDEMPYPSTRYCDLTPEMCHQFTTAFLKVLEKAVAEFQPDLILCHHLYLLTALVRRQFPAHTVYGICHNTDLRQLKKNERMRPEIKAQIAQLSHIFALHEAQKEEICSTFHLAPSCVSVLGMGYNNQIFYPQHRKKKDSVTRLIFAGKIAEKKGLLSLLRALNLLTYPVDSLKIYLAGGAGNESEYHKICQLASEIKYPVSFTGKLSQPELADLYNLCDIFVLPSFSEGLPLTVIEALSCGCSIVVTDLPGIGDWLEANTKNADISYVEPPLFENTDEAVCAALPAFEQRLANSLSTRIDALPAAQADVSSISWDTLTARILKIHVTV